EGLEAAGIGFREMRDHNGGGHRLGHSRAVRSSEPGTDNLRVSGHGFRAHRLAAIRNDGTVHAQGRAAAAFCSKLLILSVLSMVRPMSSRPLSRQCLRYGSISNLTPPPSGPRISCFSRSTVRVALAPRSASSNSFSRFSADTCTGRMPFLQQLL